MKVANFKAERLRNMIDCTTCVVSSILGTYRHPPHKSHVKKTSQSVLTVHLKVKGSTSFPLSGSASVKESRPSTALDVLPKEQDPVLVTLLWYSFRHSRKKMLQEVVQREVRGDHVPPPQHSPFANSPRRFAISRTWSSKKPEPCAH